MANSFPNRACCPAVAKGLIVTAARSRGRTLGVARTFGGDDIPVANTEGKTMLRAVPGALVRKYDYATRFPSYEIVVSNFPVSFREGDGRQITSSVVAKIVSAVKSADYVEATEQAARNAAD